MTRILKTLTPRFIRRAAEKRARHNSFYYEVAAEWDDGSRGWNADSIVQAYAGDWPAFLESIEGKLPNHTAYISYAYVLQRIAGEKAALKMLDFGGGLGHYFMLTRALLPELNLDYTCYDLAPSVAAGKTLCPQAHFISDRSYLNEKYDFVLASSALHYNQQWRDVFAELAGITAEHLFVTRLPVVDSPSFISRQHAHATSYVNWNLNRAEFLDVATSLGLQLQMEFALTEGIRIRGTEDKPLQSGYLFTRQT